MLHSTYYVTWNTANYEWVKTKKELSSRSKEHGKKLWNLNPQNLEDPGHYFSEQKDVLCGMHGMSWVGHGRNP